MDTGSDLKKTVRDRYGKAALGERFKDIEGRTDSKSLGYERGEIAAIPEGADMGLGCGTPLSTLTLKEGETVLDLGSGGGMDCFLAARQVGGAGHVIGLDMTPEMVDLARANAREGGFTNVEFILADAENLPLADDSVDVVISNCALNLVSDKAKAFAEAARVLRSGGTICLSDIVTVGATAARLRSLPKAYTACLAGAIPKEDYLSLLERAGFSDITVAREREWPFFRNFASIQVKACLK